MIWGSEVFTSFLYMTVDTWAGDWEKAGPGKRQFLSVLVITWLFSDLAFLGWPRANLGFLSPLIPRRAFKAYILKYPLSHGQVMPELCVSRHHVGRQMVLSVTRG